MKSLRLGANGAPLINRFPDHIHDPSKSFWSNRDTDGTSTVNTLLTTDKTLCTIHGNGTHRVLSYNQENIVQENAY